LFLNLTAYFGQVIGEVKFCNIAVSSDDDDDDDDDDNNNNIYLLQLGCHPVAVVILHVNKT